MPTAGERITRIETKMDDLKEDITDIKSDVKELLAREAQRDADVDQMKGQMRKIAGWVSIVVTGGINTAFLWYKAYLEGRG